MPPFHSSDNFWFEKIFGIQCDRPGSKVPPKGSAAPLFTPVEHERGGSAGHLHQGHKLCMLITIVITIVMIIVITIVIIMVVNQVYSTAVS